LTITPNDILEKRFEHSFRGYDEDQVDEFLDAVKEELENRIEENSLLCGQIMSLEEEIQAFKLGSEPSSESSDGGTEAQEIVRKAKETADKYVSDAKLTAEKIIIAANRKAEEAIDEASARIRDLHAKAVSQNGTGRNVGEFNNSLSGYLDDAKSQASGILGEAKLKAEQTMSEAKQYADNLIAEAEQKAKALYDEKISEVEREVAEIKEKYNEEGMKRAVEEAEEKARVIVAEAEEKAESVKNVMNIQIINSKQRLESIQKAVSSYKAKFEDFIKSQSKLFDDIAVEDEVDAGTGINPEAISNLKDQIVQDSEEAGGLDLGFEEKSPVNDEVEWSNVEDKFEEAVEKPAAETAKLDQSEDEIESGMDNKYSEILAQITKLEKAKDEVKEMSDDFEFKSVNPVVDMTEKTEDSVSVEQLITMAAEKNKNEPETEETASVEEAEQDDKPVISEEEKKDLKDLLDELL